MSTDTDKETPRKGWSERISEVGPAWITAISGLLAVLVGGGAYIAGHASGSGASGPAPQPTTTVTVATATVTVTATATAASPAPNPTRTPRASQTIASNGSKLGTYTVDLPEGYSIPLAASQPTQSQFDSSKRNGDLGYDDVNGYYYPLGNDRMVQLANGTMPTYQACTSSTAFTNGIGGGNLGTEFCILESGKIAGVEVVSQSSTTSDYFLKVTVWRNAS